MESKVLVRPGFEGLIIVRLEKKLEIISHSRKKIIIIKKKLNKKKIAYVPPFIDGW